jgi:hypothetical protein
MPRSARFSVLSVSCSSDSSSAAFGGLISWARRILTQTLLGTAVSWVGPKCELVAVRGVFFFFLFPLIWGTGLVWRRSFRFGRDGRGLFPLPRNLNSEQCFSVRRICSGRSSHHSWDGNRLGFFSRHCPRGAIPKHADNRLLGNRRSHSALAPDRCVRLCRGSVVASAERRNRAVVTAFNGGYDFLCSGKDCSDVRRNIRLLTAAEISRSIGERAFRRM